MTQGMMICPYLQGASMVSFGKTPRISTGKFVIACARQIFLLKSTTEKVLFVSEG